MGTVTHLFHFLKYLNKHWNWRCRIRFTDARRIQTAPPHEITLGYTQTKVLCPGLVDHKKRIPHNDQ